MQTAKTTQPMGRAIAALFANLGWGLAAIGLLLAVAGIFLGGTPGSGGPSGPVSFLHRLTASGLGVGVAVFGLFSVLMAAQTRAAIDTAEMTREMLRIARRGAERHGSGMVARGTPVAGMGTAAPQAVTPQPAARPEPQLKTRKPARDEKAQPLFSAKPPR